MPIAQANWNPSDRHLRQFAAACVVAFPLIAWLFGGDQSILTWLTAMGCMVATIGWISPKVIKPLYFGLTAITLPIGMIVSEVCLIFIYFAVVFPIAMLFRVKRRDRLQLKIDRDASTYLHRRQETQSAASYYRRS